MKWFNLEKLCKSARFDDLETVIQLKNYSTKTRSERGVFDPHEFKVSPDFLNNYISSYIYKLIK